MSIGCLKWSNLFARSPKSLSARNFCSNSSIISSCLFGRDWLNYLPKSFANYCNSGKPSHVNSKLKIGETARGNMSMAYLTGLK